MFYVIVDTKHANNLTDLIIQECAEKYGVFKSKGQALTALNEIEDKNNLNYDALMIIDIY